MHARVCVTEMVSLNYNGLDSFPCQYIWIYLNHLKTAYIVWLNYNLCNRFPSDSCLDYFQFFDIISNTAMDFFVHTSWNPFRGILWDKFQEGLFLLKRHAYHFHFIPNALT